MPSIRGLITGTNAAVWRTVNRAGVPWHKLPRPAGALNLAALREDLRHDNLIVRHFPELARSPEGSTNAFAPWRKTDAGGAG